MAYKWSSRCCFFYRVRAAKETPSFSTRPLRGNSGSLWGGRVGDVLFSRRLPRQPAIPGGREVALVVKERKGALPEPGRRQRSAPPRSRPTKVGVGDPAAGLPMTGSPARAIRPRARAPTSRVQ